MASVSIYLNYQGQAEEAFTWYREIFGGEFTALQRMDGVHGDDLPEADRNLLMHIALPILGGTVLMATDFIESMGHKIERGNNMSINLEPDDLAEGQRLHAALAEGASDVMELTPMPWGAHFGTLVDRYGIRWMFNVPS